MTTKSSIARALFVLGTALFALPLAAQEPVVVSGQPEPDYRERVSFGDLDLRRGAAQQKLKVRVHRAAERVCRQAEGPFPDYAPTTGPFAGMTCDSLTYNHAKPQIRAAIARAKAGERQLAAAFVIAAPAKTR